jgi:hypothetical protein
MALFKFPDWKEWSVEDLADPSYLRSGLLLLYNNIRGIQIVLIKLLRELPRKLQVS